MKNITNKKASIGGRINELLCEKNMMKKVFAIDMGVSVQTVSKWIHDKQNPEPKHIKRMSEIFGVSRDYITCNSDFKNFEDMKEKVATEYQMQENTLRYFLESHGYILKDVVCYEYLGVYYQLDNLPENLDGFASDIIEVTTPDNEKLYLNRDRLDSLVNDFFTLFESRLISKDVAITWDIDT